MTDWRKLAAGINPPIPSDAVEKAAPVLEALEAAFTPLRETIPPGADVWSGPEDCE